MNAEQKTGETEVSPVSLHQLLLLLFDGFRMNLNPSYAS